MKLILLFLLFINIIYSETLTKEEKEYIKNNPTITLGVGKGWEPFAIESNDGSITGFTADVLKLINQKTNANFTLKIENWNEIQDLAKNKKIDGLTTLVQTKQREEYLDFTSKFYDLEFGIFTTIEKLDTLKTKEDLQNSRIIIEKGNAVHESIVKIFELKNISYANNHIESYKKIFNNEADATITYSGYQFKLAQLKLPLLFNTNLYNKSLPLKLAVIKDSPLALSILQKGLNSISNEEYNQLKNKWQLSIRSLNDNNSFLTKEEIEYLQKKEVLKVGVSSDFKPQYISENQGLTPDLVNTIGKVLNLKIEYIEDSWPNTLENLKNKKIDFIDALSEKVAKEKGFLITPAVYNDKFILYSKSKIDINNLENLKIAYNPEIIILKNSLQSRYKDKVNLIEVNNAENGFQKLFEEKVDAYIGFEFDSYVLNTYFDSNFVNYRHYLDDIKINSVSAVRNDDPILQSILNKTILNFPSEQKKQILQKWFGKIENNSSIDLTFEEKEYLKNNPVLNLGYSLDFEPLFMKSSDNNYTGIAVDYYKLIADKLGISINYTVDDWEKIIKMTSLGELDFIPMMNPFIAQKNNLNITNTLFDLRSIIYTKKSKNLYVDSIEDLKGLKVSYNKNIIILDKFLDKYKDTLNLIPLSSNDDMFRLLNDDKVDAVIAFNTSKYILTKQFLNDIKPIHTLKNPVIGAVTAIKPNDKILHSILSKAVDSISVEDKNLISIKWLGSEIKSEEFQFSNKEKNYIKNNIFRLCELYDSYPISGVKDQKVIGIMGEYIDNIVKKTGLKFEVIGSSSIEDLKNKTNNNECDLIASLSLNQKNLPKIINSESIVEFPYAMIGDLKSFNLNASSDLKDLEIITSSNDIKNKILELYPNLNIKILTNPKKAIRKVGGKIHLVQLKPIAEKTIQEYGFNNYKLNGVLNNINQINTIGVHENHPVLLEIINKAIALTNPLLVDRLKDKYTIKEYTVINHNKFLFYALGLTIAIALFFIYRYKLLEQKNLEIRKKDQLLFQQSKMAAMGEMIGAIAHQWRQPINELSISIQNLKYDYEDNEINENYVDKFIDKNQKTLTFMSNTIDNFRNFFRNDKTKSEFNANDEIKFVLELLYAQLKDHNISSTLKGEELIINGYKNEFHQAILNIINNAKDAIIQNNISKGIININITKNSIEISDNGGGIPQNIIDRVFEPYYTTKEQGKGTGIGLYLATMLLNNIGASLGVVNIKDGAKFTIKFKNQKNEK